MSRPYAVLPLSRESSTRLLPWIIGVMVYLAAIILAGAMILASAAADWNRELTATFTVQIPSTQASGEAPTEERLKQAELLLRETPGVKAVRVIPVEVTALSLEPWLGANLKPQDLPLPRLIDVQVADVEEVDTEALAERLENEVPGAALDSHDYWRGQISSLVRALELLATIIIALIGFSAIAAVVFATRSGVAVHRDVIEVLHLIGATDDYVAEQFQRQAFRTSIIGSVMGSVLAVLTLVALNHMAKNLDAALLSTPTLATWHWVVLAIVPVFASLIATVTARRTVLRALRRMP